MINVVIAGGRDFDNFNLMYNRCNHILKKYDDVCIISGTARGADSLGEMYAGVRGYSVKRFPAQWDLYGRSAGYRRNREMALVADIVICFWDYKSKGTEHMISLSRAFKKEVHVIKY